MSCVRCGGYASVVLHPLELVACDSCGREWLREESLSMEAVCAALGLSQEPTKRQREDMKKFDAELLKRTQAWAGRKAAA